jgi:hypothetical protein
MPAARRRAEAQANEAHRTRTDHDVPGQRNAGTSGGSTDRDRNQLLRAVQLFDHRIDGATHVVADLLSRLEGVAAARLRSGAEPLARPGQQDGLNR